MRFGYNVLSIDNGLYAHLDKINPGTMVFFQNQLDAARWAKARFPQANIVIRYWPDGETFKKYPDPAVWVQEHRDLIGSGIILQTMNEGGFGLDVVLWHEKLLRYLKDNNINLKVGILGLGVGIPRPEDWPLADNLFRLAATMRDRVYLIVHEYFGGVITSGIIGGNPDNAGVAPGTPGGKNFLPLANWPLNPREYTLFHVGRIYFLKRHLDLLGIPMPQVIIGEFGADFTGDIGTWLRSLISTKGAYDTVDGWRELWDQWRRWYGQNVDVGTLYMLMGVYADRFVYDSNIVGINWFTWGTDGKWDTYRTDPDMIVPMEKYARGTLEIPWQVVVPPPVIIEPPPKPDDTQPLDRSILLKRLIQETLDNWK